MRGSAADSSPAHPAVVAESSAASWHSAVAGIDCAPGILIGLHPGARSRLRGSVPWRRASVMASGRVSRPESPASEGCLHAVAELSACCRGALISASRTLALAAPTGCLGCRRPRYRRARCRRRAGWHPAAGHLTRPGSGAAVRGRRFPRRPRRPDPMAPPPSRSAAHARMRRRWTGPVDGCPAQQPGADSAAAGKDLEVVACGRRLRYRPSGHAIARGACSMPRGVLGFPAFVLDLAGTFLGLALNYLSLARPFQDRFSAGLAVPGLT